MVEQKLLDRVDVSASRASAMAVQEALSVAGIGLDDVATFDVYSCFPVPVFAICDGVGLATDDPRGLTLTGGLPSSAARATTTRCTALPRLSTKCESAQGDSALSAPTAAS
jgi:acetyl-CoA C-acetyltransferase